MQQTEIKEVKYQNIFFHTKDVILGNVLRLKIYSTKANRILHVSSAGVKLMQ